MSHSNNEFGGYRGRRTITDILKLIAIALAVAVVLVVAGLFFLQRYIVYTDDGPRLDLPPLFRTDGGVSSSAPLPGREDISLIERPAGSQSEPVVPPEPAGFALQLSVDQVADGSAAARLEEAGAKAVILEMKDRNGRLSWYSEQELAGRAKVNARQQLNDVLRQWNEGKVYTIARVCCFRDDSLPYYRNSLALRRGEYNWRDELGLRWVSPAQEKAQAYIAGLCAELAALGFDEIVLEQFHFPIRGNLDNINRGGSYDPEQFTAGVEALLSQVGQALEPYETKLSLRVERDTLTGAESSSGVTDALLEQYAARVWVESDGRLPGPENLLEQAGITGGTERLVLIAAQPEDTPVFQGILPVENGEETGR